MSTASESLDGSTPREGRALPRGPSWGHATWTDLARAGLGRRRGKTRVVALLPVGAVEAHGPHLPLVTDVVYGVTGADARTGLLHVLRSGLVSPLNGASVLDAIGSTGGAGLLDRLIADDYTREGLDVLTLDKAMASLPRVWILEVETA